MKISSPVRGASLYEEMHIGVCERQGKRDYMEDRHEVYMASPGSNKTEPMPSEKRFTIPHAFFCNLRWTWWTQMRGICELSSS